MRSKTSGGDSSNPAKSQNQAEGMGIVPAQDDVVHVLIVAGGKYQADMNDDKGNVGC